MHWACNAAFLGFVLAACGGAAFAPSAGTTASAPGTAAPSAGTTAPAVRSVPFSEVASTQHANHDGGPEVIVGSASAARGEILRRVTTATAPSATVLIAVFQGEQRTGGYAIQVTGIDRDGDQVIVHAAFTTPPAGGFVTQVITSPAHVVSIAAGDLAGARTAILRDASGTEQARVSIA